MSNGRIPMNNERKEPQLSPLTPIDAFADDKMPQFGADHQQADFAAASSPESHGAQMPRNNASAAQAAVVKPAKTGLLWTGIFVLLFCMVGMGAYGFLELERIRGMQRSTLEQVNTLAARSDQIGDKLTTSGGQIQETQMSLTSRVSTLETSISERIEALQKTLESSQSKVAGLDKQLLEGLAAQSKSSQSIDGLKAEFTKSLAKQQSDFDALFAKQQKSLSASQKELAGLKADLKEEALGLGQSIQILREEVSDRPQARMKKLQDQFATYMQSVDQFRQQTNASINDLSSQLRDVSQSVKANRSNQAGDFGSEVDGFQVDDTDFGVQPVGE